MWESVISHWAGHRLTGKPYIWSGEIRVACERWYVAVMLWLSSFHELVKRKFLGGAEAIPQAFDGRSGFVQPFQERERAPPTTRQTSTRRRHGTSRRIRIIFGNACRVSCGLICFGVHRPRQANEPSRSSIHRCMIF